jgi:hypothetical protein
MADNYQEALIKAIETISKSQVDSLATDKTVTATIASCSDLLTNEYKVSYNGGIMTVYGASGKTYSKGSSVYVLIPEGDFTKKKIIIDSASYKEDDQNISFISSIMNDYNLIGSNTLYEGKDNEDKVKKVYPVGLNSYFRQDAKLIYQKGLTFDENGKNNLLNLNAEELETYMSQADALMIEAKFKTNLPKEHRVRGKYWLDIVIAVKDGDKTVNEFEEYLPDIKLSEEDKTASSYKDVIEKLKQYWFVEQVTDKDALKKALEEAKEETKKISNLYQKNLNNKGNSSAEIKAIKDIVTALEKFSSIQVDNMLEKSKEYIEKLESKEYIVPKPKYQTFTISSEEMTGDPHRFYDWSNQYIFCPIDTNNFLHLESIVFQSEDFVDETNITLATLKGDNIFVQNIEIYGVRKIEATDGDFKLQVGTPQGAIFYSTDESKTLEILGKTTKADIDISVNTNYYWFVEDVSITTNSSNFNYYAGAGWRWLESTKGNDKSIIIKGSENLSYENHYKCVAVYKQSVILKADITIYNYAVKRKLEIKSNIGTSFSFDRGTPILTCYVNDRSENFEEGHSDEDFKFIWSVTEDAKSTITYDKTLDELQKELEDVEDSAIDADLNDNDKKTAEKEKNSKITSLRQQISALKVDGLEFDKNVMHYPVSTVNLIAHIKCGVFLKSEADGKYQSIGTAGINLQNNSEATPTEYYILIANGDQIFQYSESGVAPDNERYTDPLEVKPLECHFYDPTGFEVNEDTYELKWKVPLSDSMIVTPTQNMVKNPATEKAEWYQGRVFPLGIQQSYNYFALNNQVTAIVTYDGKEYTQDSKLYFTKIGDNGTNGTDIVCKIEPKESPADGILALESRPDKDKMWNTDKKIGTEVFDVKIYNRGSLLTDKTITRKWSMAGGNKSICKNLIVESNGAVNTQKLGVAGKLNNQIIKAEVTYNSNSYYSYYPIYTIDYKESELIKNIYIDKTKTLKYITYNSDGRNPLFNKNQGICIRIDGDANTNYYIEWTVHGGIDDVVEEKGASSSTSSLKLYKYKEGIYYNENGEKQQESPYLEILQETPEDQKDKQIKEYEIYISPVDVYSGEYCNNLVRARIYSSKNEYDLLNPSMLAEIRIPICLTLNTYGLSSLNAWDGTHIEINEDENYILAPQIGAGEKDSKNKFTGIVMGKATTYDKVNDKGESIEDTSIGLLGYSHGKQSIWLDAESGKAIFGLPEDQASAENKYNEGRILLDPGGTSLIANWRIGSRLLYNIINNNGESGEIAFEKYKDDYAPIFDEKEKGYSISPTDRGILLSANPSYISIKGQQFLVWPNLDYNPTTDPEKIKTNSISKNILFAHNDPTARADSNKVSGKSEIYNGDSLELQLDPSQAALFGVFLHHRKRNTDGYLVNDSGIQIAGDNDDFIAIDPDNDPQKKYSDKDVVWERTPKVYIDSYGRFITNALKESSVGIAPGYVDAFGSSITENVYSGLIIEKGSEDKIDGSETICKIFTKSEKGKDNPLYISGASEGATDEYSRPLNLYGDKITLYSNPSKANSSEEEEAKNKQTESNNSLSLSNTECKIVITERKIDTSQENGYIEYPSSYSFGQSANININKGCTIKVNNDYSLTSITGGISFTSEKDYSIESNGDIVLSKKSPTSETSFLTSKINISKENISLLVDENDNYIKINGKYGDSLSRLEDITAHSAKTINIETSGKRDGVDENGKEYSPCPGNITLDSTGMEITSEGQQILIKNNLGKDDTNFDNAGEVVIQNKNSTILISPRSGIAYGSKWNASGGIQMTGNVHCTNFLTSGGGLKTKGDISTDNDCHVENYVLCRNVYWNDGSTIGGSDSVWGALIYMLNLYNSHTHTTSVYVQGQSDTQTVEIEAVSTSDKLTVGEYDDNGIWQALATGVLQKALKVSKDVTLSVPAQTLTVKLEHPDQQMWYKENS